MPDNPTLVNWRDDRDFEIVRLRIQIMNQAIEVVRLLKEAGYTPINPPLFRAVANRIYDWTVYNPEQ